MKKLLILINAMLLLGLQTEAHIILPDLFSDHMVLQQNCTVTVWGWAKPFEEVRLTCSWDPEKEHRVQVKSMGTWSLEVQTPSAGGPYSMTVRGTNTIEIPDVMIGEVWLGSGQSNMEWTPAGGIEHGEEEIRDAVCPEIRFFNVHAITADFPQQLVKGEWVKCTPETMKNFSAVLYFFGRELHRELKVPVGLISSAWGGTPIEIWMNAERVAGDRLLEQNAALLEPVPWGPVVPGSAYNAMIHPLIPFRIKGAIWYQGEANVGIPGYYAHALKNLVESWRASWGVDLSFYYVQIAPWSGYGTDNVNGAILRDQQRKALDITENTGMVVVSDIGDLKDIHPKNKIDVGKRLSLWALHNDYGRADLPFSGPLYRSCELSRGKILLRFDHADGLMAVDGDLKEFQVLDPSGQWVDAKATIIEHMVEVDPGVEKPAGIRYAYRNDSDPNLFNSAGLPASCFEVIFNSTILQ
jgi:sialate O-acetylesterase